MARAALTPVRVAAAILAVLAGAAAAGCGGGERSGPPVRSAAAFIDSVGVNVHMSYDNTNYSQVEAVRARLRELGVRHVRDGIVLGRPDQYRALNLLADDGVRAQLILGDPAGRLGTGTLEQQLATLEHELLGVADAVEGPNEYDLSGDPEWVARLRDYQSRLAAAVKGTPALARLPVVGPSVVLPGSEAALGDLSDRMDLGNIHSYPGGRQPESNLSGELEEARANSGALPVAATETGYHDAVASQDGHRPASELAVATYLPRLFLSYFAAGVRRTFAYELLDERPDPARVDLQANFGLLREDLTPKPAFLALRNLLAVLRPAGARSGASPPRYTLSDPAVAELMLDLGGDRFALVLWAPVPVWDPYARTDEAPEVRSVTVQLAEPVASAAVVRPGRSAAPEQRLERPREIPIAVPPDPVVLVLQS